MGGYYVPKSQRQGQQPSASEAFLRQFFQGYAMGEQMKAQRQQQEAFEMQRQQHTQALEYHKLNMQKIKSELALQEMFGPQQMQQQQDAQRLQGESSIFSILQQLPGQRITAPNQVEPFGLAGPPTLGPDGSQISPGAPPPMTQPQGPGSLLPHVTQVAGRPAVTSLEQTQQQGLQALLQKLQMEAQGEFAKTSAQEEAKRAPLSFSLPGVGDVTVPGTIADQVASGAMTGLNQGRAQQFQAGESARSRGFQATEAEKERGFKAAEGEKERGTKGLAGESAGRLAVSTTASNLADGLKKDFAALKGNRGRLARVVAGLDPDINRRIDDLIDASSRIRTGATAPEGEMKSKREQILRFVDLINADTGPAQAAIQRILDEANQAVSSIDPGGRHSRPGVTGSANLGSPSGGNPTATNPRTGRQVQWNGSAWVPVQ